MVGITALVGISILAIVFLGSFFAVLCRERRRTKICMLLRMQSEEGSMSQAALGANGGLYEIADPLGSSSRVVVIPNQSRGVVVQMRKPQRWSKVG